MMANSQDPRYSSIDFNAMLALYAQLKNFERETNPVDGPANRQPLALIWAPAPHHHHHHQQQQAQHQQPQQQQQQQQQLQQQQPQQQQPQQQQLQHQQPQQQLQQQQQAVNLMKPSNTVQSDRTYTELQ